MLITVLDTQRLDIVTYNADCLENKSPFNCSCLCILLHLVKLIEQCCLFCLRLLRGCLSNGGFHFVALLLGCDLGMLLIKPLRCARCGYV